MKVLGIDRGSRRTGYAIVQRQGSTLAALEYDTIVLGRGPLESRLVRLFEELERIIARHEPAAAAIEGIFYAKNAVSALRLGHARGVALLSASRAGLDVHEYAPTAVKRSVTASGRAQKDQVQRMVRMILGLQDTPDPDASDALAVAICHARTIRAHRNGAPP